MNKEVKTDGWWQAFYDETPFELWLKREQKELDATLDFLWQKLELEPDKVLFDQCCGTGSLSLPLAARGVRTIGVDLCQKFIELAQKAAAKQALDCHFYHDDAFVFSPPTKCDAAINWWTSFGYAADDSRNLLMFERIKDALKPGASFALDYPNIAHVFQNFKAKEEHQQNSPEGIINVIRETELDLERGLRKQRWTYYLPTGGKLVHQTSLRMYLPSTIKEMLKHYGFTDIKFFGNTESSDLSLDSERCICLARRAR